MEYNTPNYSEDNTSDNELVETENSPLTFDPSTKLERKYFKRYLKLSLNNLAWCLGKVSLVAESFIYQLELNEIAKLPIREDYREIYEALTIIQDGINHIAMLIVEVNNKI